MMDHWALAQHLCRLPRYMYSFFQAEPWHLYHYLHLHYLCRTLLHADAWKVADLSCSGNGFLECLLPQHVTGDLKFPSTQASVVVWYNCHQCNQYNDTWYISEIVP